MSRKPNRPPAWSRLLLSHFVGHEQRESLLGDLEEEFHHRAFSSPRSARRWYRRQTLGSLPHLAWQRMESISLAAMLWGLAQLACLSGLAWLWDVQVAQTTAWRLGNSLATQSLVVLRFIYLLLFALGYAGLGFLLAYGLRRFPLPGRRGEGRGWTVLVLVAALMVGVPLVQADSPGLLSFRLLQLSVAVAALLTGSRFMTVRKKPG